MSSGTFYVAAAVGVGFAAAVALVGVRALRQSRTVEVFEQPKQPYMLQVHPPSAKMHTLSLPVRREQEPKLAREKQA